MTKAPALPIRLLAFTAGAVVANLYYNQPLLPQIGRTFGILDGRIGQVSPASQEGYAAGLLFFVPLGDVFERRKLIVILLGCVAAALAAAAAAQNVVWLGVASFAIGATTIVPQLVIPFAAGLVEPSSRGRIVGRVMGGLLIGILAARVVAGAIGAVAGWRAMFALAAALMIILAAVLSRQLPTEPPRAIMPYRQLMASLVTVARTQWVVRDAGLIGALSSSRSARSGRRSRSASSWRHCTTAAPSRARSVSSESSAHPRRRWSDGSPTSARRVRLSDSG